MDDFNRPDTRDLRGNRGEKKLKPVLLKKHPRLRERLQSKYRLLPSLVTVMGIFCGFLAIISAIKGDYVYAAKCVLLAIILDGLDGRVARRLNACSEFGKEFDSLSDVMGFGVAPAVLVFCWAFQASADEFGLVVCFIFVVCSATRLARFNVAEPEKSTVSFTGLPTPGAAAAIVSIVYCFPHSVQSPIFIGMLMGYMLLIGYLMVSTIPFLSIKKLDLTKGNPRLNFILLAAAVALAWKYTPIVILAVSTSYALNGLVADIARRSFKAPISQQNRASGA